MKVKRASGWVAGLTAVLGIAVAVVMAAPQQSPAEIAAACIGEMGRTSDAAQDAIILIDCRGEFTELDARDSYESKYFHAAGNCSAQIEKLMVQAFARLDRTGDKCIAKLERLNANPAIISEVEIALDTERAAVGGVALVRISATYDHLGDAIQ